MERTLGGSLVLLYAACGNGPMNDTPRDARATDAPAADACPADAEAASDAGTLGAAVTIHYTDLGWPTHDKEVLLIAPSGTVKTRTRTDEDGYAYLTGVMPGDFTTVIQRQYESPILVSFLDLPDGMTIEMGLPPRFPASSHVSDLLVEMPPLEGATSCVLVMPGDHYSPSLDDCALGLTRSLYESQLEVDGTFTVRAIAFIDREVVAHAEVEGIVPVPGGLTIVEVSDWIADVDTVDVRVGGAAAWTRLETEYSLAGTKHEPYLDVRMPYVALAAGGPARVSSVVHPHFTSDRLKLEATLHAGRTISRATSAYLRESEISAATLELTVADFLPFILEPTWADGAIDWTTSGSLEGADIVEIATNKATIGCDLAGWWIYAPGDLSLPLHLPPVPEELDVCGMGATRIVDIEAWDWSDVDGYGEAVAGRFFYVPTAASPNTGPTYGWGPVEDGVRRRTFGSSENKEAEPTCSVLPVEPTAYGDCGTSLGFAFDGFACREVFGCNCGADCALFFPEATTCAASATAGMCCYWPSMGPALAPGATCPRFVICGGRGGAAAEVVADILPEATCTSPPESPCSAEYDEVSCEVRVPAASIGQDLEAAVCSLSVLTEVRTGAVYFQCAE